MTSDHHPKVWGEEIWIVNTAAYCGKKLLLKKDFQSSLHYHKKKDETFYVQSGKVVFQLGELRMILLPGNTVHVPPMTHHRFFGVEDSEIFEFSTHHDEEDSYRIEPSRRMDEIKD
jgi:mannose-6-phosphate isomerase-like protein (cupin superfamily)